MFRQGHVNENIGEILASIGIKTQNEGCLVKARGKYCYGTESFA